MLAMGEGAVRGHLAGRTQARFSAKDSKGDRGHGVGGKGAGPSGNWSTDLSKPDKPKRETQRGRCSYDLMPRKEEKPNDLLHVVGTDHGRKGRRTEIGGEICRTPSGSLGPNTRSSGAFVLSHSLVALVESLLGFGVRPRPSGGGGVALVGDGGRSSPWASRWKDAGTLFRKGLKR